MINITLPDGKIKQFQVNITGKEISDTISKSLAKKAIAVKINGDLKDLYIPIDCDAKIEIITAEDKEGLEILRHDTAHILAQAVKEIFTDKVQVTIGPAIDNGFYYDFAYATSFTSEDLTAIEMRMQEIVRRNEKIRREVWKRNDAIEFFKEKGELYKVEVIESIPESEEVSLYRQGDFVDLCRGPHAMSTGYAKYFKLTKVAGAYWRGNSQNPMLQRIYGTAWASKNDLDQYLLQLQEIEKRDHRKLGRELELFHFQEEARGIAFWHDKGWTIFRIIKDYIRKKINKVGYVEVNTPMLVNQKLWQDSGHWDKFREYMFVLQDEGSKDVLALKPMNCPCHIQIFNHSIKSYKDLPIRMAEFGSCHRYEPSGALYGLMRVRNFTQDDAHIFCMEEQITDETIKFCKLLKEVYRDFGFSDVKIKFSDRPAKRASTDEVWDKAEQALKDAIDALGDEYSINKGEGAFYGPKLEFILKDAIGRDWQCGTLQVDFVLPESLNVNYITAQGSKARPVILHRAIIGSFERFIGILIEQYSGMFPIWLAPIQVGIVAITDEVAEYAKQLNENLISNYIRSRLDISNETINYKIRNFSIKKVPLIAIIGRKEVSDRKVTVRRIGSNIQKVMSIDELIILIKNEEKKLFN